MIFNAERKLGAPVPADVISAFNLAAMSGGSDPAYQYIADRDRGHSIEVGGPKCDVPLKPKGLLNMMLYRFSVSIPETTDDGMQ